MRLNELSLEPFTSMEIQSKPKQFPNSGQCNNKMGMPLVPWPPPHPNMPPLQRQSPITRPRVGPQTFHTLPNMGVPPQCPPLSGVSPHRLRLLSGQHMLPHLHPLVWPHPLFTLPQPRPHQVIGQLARLSHLHQSNSSVRKLAFMPVKYKGK